MRIQVAARHSARLFGLGLLLLLGMASQVAAATITATFAGTVKTGLDTTGVFGTPGADLAGAGYSLVFTIDTVVGAYSTFNGTITDPLLSGDQIFGGSAAVITINGHSYSFAGDNAPSRNFDIAASKPGSGTLAYQVANSALIQQFNAFLSTSSPTGFPTSVLASTTLSSCPPATCSFFGSFIIPVANPSRPSLQGYLNFGSLNVSVATTPIPAALPLLVSALGGLGLVGWRRRQAEAA
jgi:hypothetical protein